LESQNLDILEEEIAEVNTIKEIKILLGSGAHGIVHDMLFRRKLSLLGFVTSHPRFLGESFVEEVEK
jgi:hypothetical protein